MTLENLYMLSQVIAAFAIVGSLIFVGLQMRHSEKAQRSATFQARAVNHMEAGYRWVEPHNQAVIAASQVRGRELSAQERQHLSALFQVILRGSENAFRQHQEGLLDAAALRDQGRILGEMFSNPTFRAVWRLRRDIFSDVFRDFVDDIMEATSVQSSYSESDETWVTLWDEEAASLSASG